MIRNYLVITFRNFLRDRNYTLINILGLSIGITSCIIIFLLVTYDLSFDKFHSKYDHIYRIVQQSENASGDSKESTTPYPLARAFRNDFSEVPRVTQIHAQDEVLVKIGDEKVTVEDVVFADSLFFDVFDFTVLSGNPRAELGQPGKVFLTKSYADKLLKGKEHGTLRLDNRDDVEVVGIIQDPPATSHIKFSMIVSMPTFNGEYLGGIPITHWDMTANGYTYLVLPENISRGSIESQFPSFTDKYHGNRDSDHKSYSLQPLKDIHFDKEYKGNPGPPNAEYSDMVVMAVLGLFILIIACINFINLATALAIRKSKEIGIRKTLGAKRLQLTGYFLGETLILTLVAVLISLCVTEWMLPWLNGFLERNMALELISNPWLSLYLVILILFVTFLSGFYPAMILSGYNPVIVLKGRTTTHGSSRAVVRKLLVVFQFSIAQVLIIGTLVIASQMAYFKNKPLGFKTDAVLNIPVPAIKKEFMESLRARLEQNHNIQQVSFSLGAPTSENNIGTRFFLSAKGAIDRYNVNVKPVDRHYLETYGLKLKAGRWFTESDERQTEVSVPDSLKHYVYIINEQAMRKMGFNSPEEIIGKNITTGIDGINAEVVGVVEDFHEVSLHTAMQPVILMNFPSFYYNMGLKINTANLPETLRFIEDNWSAIFPEYSFEYEFMDDQLAKLYRRDERTFTLFKIFAGISIFIGCLGLYGLISFMAHQKIKEIGVRKVLGASVVSIVFLFSREFIRLILIAFVIAAPLSWYFMNKWLDSFAYKESIHLSAFAIAIISTLLISLITISYRCIRAAVTNPAQTLRTE